MLVTEPHHTMAVVEQTSPLTSSSNDSFKSGTSAINISQASCRDIPNKLFSDIVTLRQTFTQTMSALLKDDDFDASKCLTEIKLNSSKTVIKADLCLLFSSILNAVRPICQQQYTNADDVTPVKRPLPSIPNIDIDALITKTVHSVVGNDKIIESIAKQVNTFNNQLNNNFSTNQTIQGNTFCSPKHPAPEQDSLDNLGHDEKHISEFVNNYIEEEASELLECLGKSELTPESGRSVASFGETYKYNGSRNDPVEFPVPIKKLLDKLNNDYNQQLNSCVINRYDGPTSFIPSHADNERCIDPESAIFTVSLGQTRAVEFVNIHNGEKHTHKATDKSLYAMSRKSQDVYKHSIPADPEATGVRYSLTFRTVSWKFHNSTIVLGDSNTNGLKFCATNHTGSAVGTFGKSMPGKQIATYYVDQLNPAHCLGYSNVVVHCGINSIRKRHVRSVDDVRTIYEEFKNKLTVIRKYNKRCKLIVCPLLPTKFTEYNRKANMFNNLIASDLINSNISVIVANHGSSTFVDSEGFLCKSLSSVKEGDVLHLNGKGKGQFA